MVYLQGDFLANLGGICVLLLPQRFYTDFFGQIRGQKVKCTPVCFQPKLQIPYKLRLNPRREGARFNRKITTQMAEKYTLAVMSFRWPMTVKLFRNAILSCRLSASSCKTSDLSEYIWASYWYHRKQTQSQQKIKYFWTWIYRFTLLLTISNVKRFQETVSFKIPHIWHWSRNSTRFLLQPTYNSSEVITQQWTKDRSQ